MKPKKMKAWPLTLVAAVAAAGVLLLAPSTEAKSASTAAQDTTGTQHSWVPTEGPSWQPKGPWVGGGDGVFVQGTITPPLPPAVTGKITSVSCVAGSITPPLSSLWGSATGASFTLYIKGSAFNGCDPMKVCYTTSGVDEGGEPVSEVYCIEVANPSPTAVGIDPTVTGITRDIELTVPIVVTGRDQQVKTAFTGSISVIAGSLQGSGVLVNGATGMVQVRIVEGIGSMTVRTVNGIQGDTLTFDMFGDGRMSPRRSSLKVW